jgi:HEAT repeat protein
MKRPYLAPRLLAPAVFAALLLLPLAAQQKIQIVASPLTQELVKIFPDLASGYIDFNGNGKPDQTADLNEVVPESRIRDGQLQAQEMLDFIVANWRFISLDKLKAVQTAVKNSSGALNELIAIDFAASLDDAIRQRDAMGEGLYLTPSAYKDAMDRLGSMVSAMSAAYKKEGQKGESDFVAARDNLFASIDKGFPLPKDLPAEDRAVVSTAAVNIILKEKATNPQRTRTAIKVLGQLKSTEAAGYLLDLASGTDYPIEAMRALADIAYKPAIPVLAKQLKTSATIEVRKAALQATGAIGGADGLDTILDLVKPGNKEKLPPDLLEATAQALAGIALKGNGDQRIQAALKDLSGSDRSSIRSLAAAGLGAFSAQPAVDSLLALVNGDKDPGVRRAAVVALNKQQRNDAVMPALMKVLKEKDLPTALKITTIQAIGDNAQGSLAISALVDGLADTDPGVRTAAGAALQKLFTVASNQPLVTGSLTRALTASNDENFLGVGTALLATLADPSTLPTLLALLQKPQPEVKRNAAWALYRLRNGSNPKVSEELQKLVTNENETIATRVNAVRALGAIGLDNATLNIWQTLVTTAQMRGEKYAMLRFFAVRALGEMGGGRPQVLQALARLVARDPDPELRKEAVSSLQVLASANPEAIDALAGAYALSDDSELKLRIVEALADMGSDKASDLGADLLAGTLNLQQKRRVVFALSEQPSEASASAMLDAAKDPALADFVEGSLEGFPKSLITPIVGRRLKLEADKNILAVLSALDSRFSE